MTQYVWFVRGARHAAMCRTSIESVKRVDKTAQCSVITDEPIDQKSWSLDAATYFIEPGMPIMLANLEAQVVARFVCRPSEPIVYLDADILVLEPIVAPLADLTVTWRDHVRVMEDEKIEGIASEMPYNYGLMVAQPGMAATEALIWMRERIRKMHSRHQQWYGNQLALFELAGPRPAEGTRIDTRPIPWTLTQYGNRVTIAKVPCEVWNYTPQKVGEAIHGKRKVLHFKGHSRTLMESYAKRLGLTWEAKAA